MLRQSVVLTVCMPWNVITNHINDTVPMNNSSAYFIDIVPKTLDKLVRVFFYNLLNQVNMKC